MYIIHDSECCILCYKNTGRPELFYHINYITGSKDNWCRDEVMSIYLLVASHTPSLLLHSYQQLFPLLLILRHRQWLAHYPISIIWFV